MKDAYYFSHDANAHNDPKMLALRISNGWAWVGLFWTFLEILRDMPGYVFPEESLLATLELRLSTPQATLEAWLKDCLKHGLLVSDNGSIYSESFLCRMNEMDERRQKLSEGGRRGGIKSSQAKASLKPSSSSKVNESKVKEIKESNIGRFAPPTQEEVIGYFTETLKATKDQAVTFFEFYGSKGWVVGKAPMKNWHLAASRSLKWATNTTTQVKKYESKPFPTNA